MKLLFIEDDRTYFNWLKAHLTDHDVRMAATIEEAEIMMVRERFDAVFVDLKMPRHNPSVIIARARAAAPTVPLIVLSGTEMRCDLAAVCDGFVYKGGLHEPELEIPHAVNEFTNARESMHIYDRAAQLYSAVRSLRHSARTA